MARTDRPDAISRSARLCGIHCSCMKDGSMTEGRKQQYHHPLPVRNVATSGERSSGRGQGEGRRGEGTDAQCLTLHDAYASLRSPDFRRILLSYATATVAREAQ